jgi:hypothetical protein
MRAEDPIYSTKPSKSKKEENRRTKLLNGSVNWLAPDVVGEGPGLPTGVNFSFEQV